MLEARAHDASPCLFSALEVWISMKQPAPVRRCAHVHARILRLIGSTVWSSDLVTGLPRSDLTAPGWLATWKRYRVGGRPSPSR
jgi:hypothetical protein